MPSFQSVSVVACVVGYLAAFAAASPMPAPANIVKRGTCGWAGPAIDVQDTALNNALGTPIAKATGTWDAISCYFQCMRNPSVTLAVANLDQLGGTGGVCKCYAGPTVQTIQKLDRPTATQNAAGVKWMIYSDKGACP